MTHEEKVVIVNEIKNSLKIETSVRYTSSKSRYYSKPFLEIRLLFNDEVISVAELNQQEIYEIISDSVLSEIDARV